MLFTIAVVVYYSNRYDERVGGLAEDTMNDAVDEVKAQSGYAPFNSRVGNQPAKHCIRI